MKTVQPIKDIDQIHKIESILKEKNTRDFILFELGIYSGLRISDILNLKVKDLRNQDYFILKEQKTNKAKRLKINPILKEEISNYIKSKPDVEYLIKSQKGDNKPISRIQAWEIINDVARKVGIKGEIGTHSLRKTWAYNLYQHSGKDVAIVQKLLNHSSQSITLRYIGIEQENMDDLICSIKY
jgi:integrase